MGVIVQSGQATRLAIPAGAVVVSGGSAVIGTIISTGATTVAINDCATLGAVAAGNLVATLTMTAGQVVVLNFPCRSGIVVNPTGGACSVSYS